MNLKKLFPQSNSILFKSFLSVITLFLFNVSMNAATFTVSVSSNQFSPSNLSVNVGDTIKFQWMNGSHTTTCDGIFPGTSLPSGAAPWDAQMNSGSPVYVYVITVSGTYNYVCRPHAPSMAGVITATGAGGSVFLTENFNYPVGDSLGSHGWTSFSGGSTNVLSVTSPGLVYSGYPLSNIGNATTVMANGQDAYTSMSSQVDSTGADGTALYCSFMVNVTSAQIGDYFLAFLPANSTTFYSGRVHVRSSGGNLNFGITKGASTDTTQSGIWTTGNYSTGTTYLIVLKFKFVAGSNNDLVSLYIFSSGVPSTEPTPVIGPLSFPSGDPGNIGRVALRQGTSTRGCVAIVDGIRVANYWNGLITSLSNNTTVVPGKFYLSQNYPNPFNPNTTIKFSIPERGNVNLTIYNSLGKEVGNLINSNLDAGSFSYNFDGSNLNSGVYFYKLSFTNGSGNNFIVTKKFVLLK